MAKSDLTEAKRAKNDEFYTQYADIEKEISAYLEFNPDVFRGKTILLPCDDPEWSNFTKYFAQNFERLGLRKLISTSYAVESKTYKGVYQPTLFETSAPYYDKKKTKVNGKIFTLAQDKTGDHHVNVDDLEWQYLQGDGDFRSAEIKTLRDEADIIITNPPFSLFREFLAWIVEADKKFVIIGSKNAITYKEVFPLIKDNKMWVGTTSFNKDMLFISPEEIDSSQKPSTATRTVDGIVYLRSPSVWFTNLDHGRRHQPLPLMTMAENLKYSKHKEIKGKQSYDRYDNYDAIEVPFTDTIPSDFDGLMGVPVSFLDKYSPDQFEIIDALNRYALLDTQGTNETVRKNQSHTCNINGVSTYFRIVIRKKGNQKAR
ncbi:MAG: adenine-specific methyltransferase EcoRI family protein [Anaerolineae bacterium]|nr:adenine-specific methyltransferase EcoRI family protein [Anaerolineae bacterium]